MFIKTKDGQEDVESHDHQHPDKRRRMYNKIKKGINVKDEEKKEAVLKYKDMNILTIFSYFASAQQIWNKDVNSLYPAYERTLEISRFTPSVKKIAHFFLMDAAEAGCLQIKALLRQDLAPKRCSLLNHNTDKMCNQPQGKPRDSHLKIDFDYTYNKYKFTGSNK